MGLYLNVPYEEKEEAKSLGAKWNPKVKKWYTDASPKEYVKFSKWLLKDTDDVIIAQEYIYIIEGEQKCWKCKQMTKVIGLGISDYVHIYGEVEEPFYELSENYMYEEELHLSWVDVEEKIPPKLLKYLKKNYSVKTGYSKTIGGKCFANHCEHCKALQGNWFLFNEDNSPLSTFIEGNQLIERISKLKIKGIPIDDDLQLDWEIEYCTNDDAYFRYGHFEEIILSSDPESCYITYEEMYEL